MKTNPATPTSLPAPLSENTGRIHIEGARHHNLKDLTLDLPREKLVVVCGPSGSGKSTLAFDIVYAEGQRRYVESLSAYARQFLPQMDKPDVDKVEGLTPAISLEQQTATRNPRSTVGTVTEVYDFLRVFFARLGRFHCPQCSRPIAARTAEAIVEDILALPEGTRFLLLAPLVDHQKGTHKELFAKLSREGFVRVRVNGEVHSLESAPELDKKKKHTVELVVDRLVAKPDLRRRLVESVELALTWGKDSLIVAPVGRTGVDAGEDAGDDAGGETLMSTLSACPQCRISMPRLTPQLFSFNSPQGACPQCSGIGTVEYFEPDLIAPNKGLGLNQGAVIPWKKPSVLRRHAHGLERVGHKLGFGLDTPLEDYSDEARQALFFGREDLDWPGVVGLLEMGHSFGPIWRDELARYRRTRPCPACQGARLRPESLAVRVGPTDGDGGGDGDGESGNSANIFEFTSFSIARALAWLETLSFSGPERRIAEPLMKELTHRLGFMVNVGLDYISLGRTMATLSGGESQRIRLASQLGSGLVGVTYVLDEPSIGLHPRDNQRLLDTLRSLQGRGNTVLVVEHDEETIVSADHVLELGPGSGWLGGEVVFQGGVDQLMAAEDSLTARYLRGDLTPWRPDQRRDAAACLEGKGEGCLSLRGVSTNNLKDVDIDIPLGALVCFTGVSGSGKSSLVVDTLYKHLALMRGVKVDEPGRIRGIHGHERVEKIVAIDQTPIGRTPRSNPATYTKVFDDIRKLFAGSKEAKKRGYAPGRFSFNVRGGRCEACRGDGQIRVEMHFLPDVYVTCEACKGKRYNQATLEVEYRGRNIAEVLDMTVRQASAFFENHPALKRKLSILEEVGLEYLRLGQPATTLSGGEAQRIKISRELGKRSLPGTLYVLDEPTTGLHMHEVGKLTRVLHTLVDKGATVVVIEHNTDVILAADWVFDLGPGGGEAGGEIIAQGTPEALMADKGSVTGEFLR